MARAFFTNVASWQDDEERALLLTDLYQRAAATSWFDATATRLSPGVWLVCRWTVTPLTPPYEVYSCYRTDDGGTHNIEGCPGVAWPNRLKGSWFRFGRTDCACLTSNDAIGDWDFGLGDYGGWKWEWSSCDGYLVHVTVDVIDGAFPGAPRRWRFRMEVDGVLTYQNYRTFDCTPGFQFSFHVPGPQGPCPDSILDFRMDW